MALASYQTLNFGCNPFVLDTIPTATGTGTLLPQFDYGHVSYGSSEMEVVYCKLTLGSTTNILPGMLFVVDNDYNAVLAQNSAAYLGCIFMVGLAAQWQVPAGTYGIWLARAGQVPLAYNVPGGTAQTFTASNVLSTQATTVGVATAGSAAGTFQLTNMYWTKAIPTFTATNTSGSPWLTGPFTISSGVWGYSGPIIGAAISGTGIPASTFVGGFYALGGGNLSGGLLTQQSQILMVNSTGAAVNATSSNSAITVTASGVGEAQVRWSQCAKAN